MVVCWLVGASSESGLFRQIRNNEHLTAALRIRKGFAIISLVGAPVEPLPDFRAFFPAFVWTDHDGIALGRDH